MARHGLRASQLSGIAAAYLDQWSRLAAKTELLDAWLAEHGLLRTDGEPQPCLALYVSLHNAQRLALARLEQSLRAGRDAPGPRLAEYLDALDDDEDEDDAAAA